jgi:hypothetical protein
MTSGELLVRITVQGPPPGVEWAIQLGRDDLLPPSKRAVDLEFEVTLRVVDGPGGLPDLRGPAVQGPRNARFIYLNSGTRAGQASSRWDRRAKVSLEGLRSILKDETRAAPSVVCAAAIAGTGRDGGPACASVPLVGTGWRVLPRRA